MKKNILLDDIDEIINHDYQEQRNESTSDVFANIQFNGDTSKCNFSRVTDISDMFTNIQLKVDTSSWNNSTVTDISDMFPLNEFKGGTSKCNVGNIFYKNFIILNIA